MFDTGEKNEEKKSANIEAEIESKKQGVAKHISKMFDSRKKDIEALDAEIAKMKEEKKNREIEINQSMDILLSKSRVLEADVVAKRKELTDLEVRIIEMKERLSNENRNHLNKLADLEEIRKQNNNVKMRLEETREYLDKYAIRLDEQMRNQDKRESDLLEKEKKAEEKMNSANILLDTANKRDAQMRSELNMVNDEINRKRDALDKDIKILLSKQEKADEIITREDKIAEKEKYLEEIIKEANTERDNIRKMYENIRIDSNELAVLRKNLTAMQADLKRREKEIQKLEAKYASN